MLGHGTASKAESVKSTVPKGVTFANVYYCGDDIKVALYGDATQKSGGVAREQGLVVGFDVVFIIIKGHGGEGLRQF